jgi:hypothetical protein
MYLTSRLGDGRIVARYHREINAFSFGGALHPASDWVQNFEGSLTWRAGGEGKPVSVDMVLESLADALWLEVIKTSVCQHQRS